MDDSDQSSLLPSLGAEISQVVIYLFLTIAHIIRQVVLGQYFAIPFGISTLIMLAGHARALWCLLNGTDTPLVDAYNIAVLWGPTTLIFAMICVVMQLSHISMEVDPQNPQNSLMTNRKTRRLIRKIGFYPAVAFCMVEAILVIIGWADLKKSVGQPKVVESFRYVWASYFLELAAILSCLGSYSIYLVKTPGNITYKMLSWIAFPYATTVLLLHQIYRICDFYHFPASGPLSQKKEIVFEVVLPATAQVIWFGTLWKIQSVPEEIAEWTVFIERRWSDISTQLGNDTFNAPPTGVLEQNEAEENIELFTVPSERQPGRVSSL
ncbi:hypothetical protein BT63DRAFT_421317 [Microthyrium microscopicum]|uniref:Uncharacterized protein n=1 Tax=Microthyrium microscopicum TaxID=703497 RepID=A0A6A6UNW0_9PEZI|nr:hypothetical protein BT63DRAFT_421317 [Microthyrium microscopicum]